MFVVIAPVKVWRNVEDRAVFCSASVEDAKRIASDYRSKYQKKGYDSWANRVKVFTPKTAEKALEFANMLSERAKEIDSISNGNSFQAEELFKSAKQLRAMF